MPLIAPWARAPCCCHLERPIKTAHMASRNFVRPGFRAGGREELKRVVPQWQAGPRGIQRRARHSDAGSRQAEKDMQRVSPFK